MSTAAPEHVEVAVIGAGVVGCAVTLALARRGAAVALLEAEPEPALGASATNSGILHTGFDSPPGELETDLILAASSIRDGVLEALDVPVLRCGAVMRPQQDSDFAAIDDLRSRAKQNGVTVRSRSDGSLEIPGEAVTDPVAYTLAFVSAARLQGAELRTGFRAASIDPGEPGVVVRAEDGRCVSCRVVVNCAGLHADAVARLAGDDSFEIYPRKGEFLVFEPPEDQLEQIVLPIPRQGTKGVLVFPSVDGKVIAGPTAVDLEDKGDWSVRPRARQEIMAKATSMYPALENAEPVAVYAGLRPAGRGVNYVIGPSRACPQLVNVAAIRSTGLTASLGIGQRVAEIVSELGVSLGGERPLQGGAPPKTLDPWWRRTAKFRAAT